jgi:hypothetical protein
MTKQEIMLAGIPFYSTDPTTGAVVFDVQGFANFILAPVEAERDEYKARLDVLSGKVFDYAAKVIEAAAAEGGKKQ